MNKKTRRLTLSRETLVRLDEPMTLRIVKGANGRVDVSPVPLSQEPNCISPLCMPTYWKGCETQQAG